MKFLLILFVIISLPLQAKPKTIVYLPSWINWELDRINLEDVNEVKVAFFPIDKSKKITEGLASSETSFAEYLQQVKDLKEIYSSLKVSIAIGGGTYPAKAFSKVITDKNGRKTLIDSIISELKQTDFDGVSIDWEYPNARTDKKNFKQFLKELKGELLILEKANKKHYLLSYSIPNSSWIAQFVDLKDSIKYVDYIEVMAYDLVGGFSKKTGHNANLFQSSQDDWATSTTIDYLNSIDIPNNQIAIGIPFYGIKIDNVTKTSDGLYNDILVTNPAKVKYLSYYQIQTYYLPKDDYKKFKSLESNSSYLFNINEGQFITYLDGQEVKTIAKYVTKNDMYGTMIWHIWQDDGNLTLFNSNLSGLK